MVTQVHPSNPFIEFKIDEIEQSLVDRFVQQAKRHPTRLAVALGNQRLTYEELNRAANRVAHAILASRGKKAEPVALIFEPSPVLAVAILGVLKASRIWVPIDPSYPSARIDYILKDSQATLILTNHQNSKLVEKLRGNAPVLNVEDLDANFTEQDPDVPCSPDDLAYILYTSGSTGQPKGVIQNHRNVLHSIRGHTNALHICAEDRLSMLASCSHLAGVTAIFRALLNGAAVFPFHVKEEGIEKLADWLIRHEITIYNSVPLVFRHLVATLDGTRTFPKLRLIHLGGESVFKRDVELYKTHFSKECVLLNNLGSTEASSYRQYFIHQDTPISENIVPVGYPVEDKDVTLLDEQGAEVETGEVGEITIESDYLAIGYWNQREATRQSFRPSPRGGRARIFKTGDLGRMLPDGRMVHLGRKDSQIKIRGHRIEIAEIKTALLDHPEIQESCVVTRKDVQDENRLIAYIVWRATKSSASSVLRAFLQERLPDYMVPSLFVELKSLPLTPNGKVDVQALPDPDFSRSDTPEVVDEPQTVTEKFLAEIWKEVLKVKQIARGDHFLELGGHSLSAARVVSRANKVFDVQLPLRRIFEYPILEKQAAFIQHLQEDSKRQKTRQLEWSMTPETVMLRDPTSELSLSQQRLWFLNQLDPQNPAYHISSVTRLVGPLKPSALESSFTELIRRHEILRTVFPTVDGEASQQVLSAQRFKLSMEDFRHFPANEREARALEWAGRKAARPFDLAGGPLLRATLLCLGDREHLLVIVMHHIISDAWSMGVFFKEMTALYAGYSTGTHVFLEELPIQYADFAQWQRRYLSEDVLENQLSYWKTQLDGIPALLELPADRSRHKIQSFNGAKRTFSIPPSVVASLRKVAKDENATLFMVLLSAFQTLLHRYSHQSDIVVGSPIAGRQWQETERLIGFFVNTLVLRGRFSEELTFRQFLKQVRETALEAYSHQDVPFEKLVEALHPDRSLSQTPLFQVMFVLQNAPRGKIRLSELTASPVEIDRPIAMFDLTLALVEESDGLKGELEYSTDLFDAATIERMEEHFQNLLQSIVEGPDQRVSELSLLTDHERRKILVDWNKTEAEFSREKSYSQLFEEQVSRTPDAAAIRFKDQFLTYAELNRKAEAFALHLQSLGVGPEIPVGLCMHRCFERGIGLLAILKAGGAFVPLDPAHPKERLEFMLRDSGAKVLLTTSDLRNALPAYSGPIVCVDVDPERDGRKEKSSPAAPENLAYVIYTSGSTGKPKGVQITHRSMVNHNEAMIRAYHLSPQDRVLQFASISFDLSLEEIFPTWLAGATLVIRTDEVLASFDSFFDFVERGKITVLNLPTAYWHVMVLSLEERRFPSCVRLMIVGGEQVSAARYDIWRKNVGPEVVFFNGYGPTETTVTSTLFKPDAWHENLSSHALPIGKPIANTLAYILDSRYRPVPVGVPGELYIGGAGVARGYLNQAGLTAEKFIRNPFVHDPEARIYRTGDLARYLPDGNMEFLGRLDEQVKIRGFRIELEEIETVLKKHPTVQEVVVLARDDVGSGKCLVAYLVLKEGAASDVSDIKKFLKDQFPDYMVPSFFVTLDKLPLTPHGKVDRKSLPRPAQDDLKWVETFVSSRNEIEEQLVGIWKRVLGISRVGVRDSFFDLGGHSLLVVRLFSEIGKTFGHSLPLTALFQASTIEQMASLLRETEIASESCIVPLQPQGTKPPLFWLHTLGGGGGGGLFRYKNIADLLGPDQPSYGIRAPREPFATLEEMAAHYLKQIRAIQPSGPYYLAGYCFGGTLAFELAQQLYQRGEKVAFLGVIEAVAREKRKLSIPLSPASISHFLANFYYWLEEFFQQGKKSMIVRIQRRVKSLFHKLLVKRDAGAEDDHVEAVLDGWNYPKEFRRYARIHWLALLKYVCKPYPGRVTVFRVRKQRLRNFDPSLGWKQFAQGGVQVRVLPGSHESMVDQSNFQILAREVKVSLEEIDGGTDSAPSPSKSSPNKRILHVPRRFLKEEWGGTETVVLEISKYQQREGWQPEIFTSLALSRQKRETIEGVPVRRFPYCYPFFGLSTADRKAMDKKGGNLLSISLFKALLTTPHVRLFHAHVLKRLGGEVRTAAKWLKKPYVVTIHGGVFDVPAAEMSAMTKPMENKWEWGKPFGALFGSRKVLEDADHVICVGLSELEKAKKQISHKRISWLPNAVDFEKFKKGDGAKFRRLHGIPSDAFVILNISRIDEQKNQLLLLKAFARFHTVNSRSHLILIGPETKPDYAEKLRTFIRKNHLEECVKLLPGIQNDDPALVHAYHSCDVFVLPSIHEPFGIVVLEAWSCGKPVIASQVGGLKALVTDGETGLFVDPTSDDSVEQLTDRLRTLDANKDFAREMGLKGLHEVKTKYGWQVIGKKLDAIYAAAESHFQNKRGLSKERPLQKANSEGYSKPLRVLFISNLYPPDIYGGCEILCEQVCRELEQRGHEVSVLTSQVKKAPDSYSQNGSKIFRDLRLVLPFEEKPDKITWKHQRDTYRQNYEATQRAISRVKPDLVFIWSQRRSTLACVRAVQALERPMVFTFNDEYIAAHQRGDLLFRPRRVFRSLLGRVLLPGNSTKGISFRHVTCISETLKQGLIAKGLPIHDANVIFQGIPLEKFPCKADPGSLNQPVKVLYAGSLLAQKGVHTIIDAAHLAAKRAPGSFVLSIVGDGSADYKRLLHRKAKQGKAAIEFYEKTPYAEMSRVYRQHDILVFASNELEAFGLTPLEAMASGTTVISTTRGGQGEMLRHEENALVFEEENSVDLAAQLERLIRDSSFSRRLAGNARAMVEKNFSLQRYCCDIESFLKDAFIQEHAGLTNGQYSIRNLTSEIYDAVLDER